MGKFTDTVDGAFTKGLKWAGKGLLAGALIGAIIVGGGGALIAAGAVAMFGAEAATIGSAAAATAIAGGIVGSIAGGIRGALWGAGTGAAVGAVAGYKGKDDKGKEGPTTSQKIEMVQAQNEQLERASASIAAGHIAARQQAASGFDNEAKGNFAPKAQAQAAAGQATANSVA